MRLQVSLMRWAGRAWRAAKAGVVVIALLIVALAIGHDAAARARANTVLSALSTATPSAMPGMGSGTSMNSHDAHMVMTSLRGKPNAADIAAAQAILAAAREAAAKYGDITTALGAGYKKATPFIRGMAHYTNYAFAGLAGAHLFDPRRPTSLLYTRSGMHYTLAGVMLTAPESDTVSDLNALVPTSIARWHYHHDLCISGVMVGRAPNAASCVAGGGVWWAKTVWMLHIWTDQPDLAHAFAPDHPATS